MKEKLKIKTALEFLWYALIGQAVTSVYFYVTNHGQVVWNHLWANLVSLPIMAFCIYKGHTHLKLGIQQMKDSYKK